MTEDAGFRLEEATRLASQAAEPAAVGNVLFGTAGWTDPSLVKSHLFYPRGSSTAEARLSFYARHFGLVEVDATYYTLLAPDLVARWVGWTPPSFRFDVKAHPVLTGHPIDVARLPADLRAALPTDAPGRLYPDRIPPEIAAEIEARFRGSLEPLISAARLGAILLQFPPWFGATRVNARRIESVVSRWAAVPLAVEFRNKTWLETSRRERVLALLREAKASYVVVDEPDVPLGGVPPVLAVTNPELAIVRFHGHNVSGWRRGATVAERFDYLYSPEELAAWALPIRRLSNEARTVHAVFNNCVRNHAVLGAKGLSVLLAGTDAGSDSRGG